MDSMGGKWSGEKARMPSSGTRRPLESHAGCNGWVERRRHNVGWLREYVGHCDMTCGAPAANGVDKRGVDGGWHGR